MISEPKILISILNWNNAKDTIVAIKSVLDLDYKNFEVIIIDNASTDNSIKVIGRNFPNINLVQTKSNLGYAGGHKISAKYAIENGFVALWILNNDVIVKKDSLSELVLAYQKYEKAIFGSITLGSDKKTINYGGGAEMIDKKTIDRESGYNKFGGLDFESNKVKLKTRIISDLNGASIFIPTDIIKKYGFISTRWFLYGEETDYCHYLRYKHEISSFVVPKSIVIHSGSATLNKNHRLTLVKDYYFTRNINILYKKYFPNYKITGFGNYGHLLKFFTFHYLKWKKKRTDDYWKAYYTKLGQFHSLIRLRGKYVKPEKFL